jgi:predicted AlkP superfamily pyrophosphatase or phosphodiesterase
VNKKYLFLLFFICNIITTIQTVDQVVIVIVIDQFGYEALQKIAPYLQGGIKEFLDNGICYENAHFPYARTSTGPGHATLNTGTLPRNHGIVSNYWYTQEGEKIACDHDSPENAAIFAPNGLYKNGKSAKNIKTDGISDQMMLASTKTAKNKAIAISLKSRAAIFLAGNGAAQAIWYDKKSGNFTSSEAFFKKLPNYVIDFNNEKKIYSKKTIFWKLYHKEQSPAYSMVKKNYNFARLPSLINKKVTYDFFKKDLHKKHTDFDPFSYTPESNKILLHLAQETLQNALKKKPKKILLWISLSSLDKIGHIYGPDSFEYIDTLYHIDHYLKNFMDTVRDLLPKEKILFTLTADHGVIPMVELLAEENFKLPYRLITKPLEKKMNALVEKKYGITNCIKEIDVPSIFLDHTKLNTLKRSQQKKLLVDLKNILKTQPGIKNAWTHKELEKIDCLPNDFTVYYKNQLFPGRTGSLIYQTYPYVYVTDDPLGTGHVSCYNNTTHVPLMFLQSGTTIPKKITKRISMAQVAPTLAKKLSISSPSACVEESLQL